MNIKGHSKIAGIGAFLPKTIVNSEDIMHEIKSRRFGIPENFISKRMGIKQRRVSDDKTLPSDLAILASEIALKDAGVAAIDIDMILFCGIDRDWQEPSTAHRVQSELGAHRAMCMDVTNACHGFMNGLSIADAYIASGAAQQVLVCTGEKPSNVMNEAIMRIKNTSSKTEFRSWLGALTVGDAGGAMLVQATQTKEDTGWNRFHFQSAGEHAELCYYRHTEKGIEGNMSMSKISQEFVGMHRNMIEETYNQLSWKPEEIDHLYCHQVGTLPHQQLAELAEISLDNAPITYKEYGNLTSATIPVTMHLNRPERGDKLLILGAGSGLSICQAGMIF